MMSGQCSRLKGARWVYRPSLVTTTRALQSFVPSDPQCLEGNPPFPLQFKVIKNPGTAL
ncbi:hypothetical protein BT93_F0935 [Corymbia citriodora subsp. variegata]|nr:hypothetical protein BT93_F0935 [Corymbia citriodora subsp. variegata]